MNTMDFTQINVQSLITHHIGNKLREENIQLSTETTKIQDDTLEYLLKYFLLPFKPVEFFSFFHSVKLELNEVYSMANAVFSKQIDFITASENLARLLYEYSLHPNIHEGKLNIARFSNITLRDELVDAIGIFKSETDLPFLKMTGGKSSFSIEHEFGFDLKGMDKGCLIFNVNQSTGYEVLVVDNTNRSSEAKYWIDDFLQVKPCSDEYYHTKEFLNLTKNYLTNQMDQEFEISKPDKIDLLNRSVDYFKENQQFDKNEFEDKIFQDPQVIHSFRKYDETFRQENDLELSDRFDISAQAVKKQSRIFKSVLKLDKNFHVYIHGDRNLIEQGTENDGRKFYKIYYDKEA